MNERKTCPICGFEITGPPAISRVDNEIEICSSCSIAEALLEYFNYMESKEQE